MKTILTLLAILFATIVSAQNTKFSGKIIQPKGEMVYLRWFGIEGGRRKVVRTDSTKLKNGEFQFVFDLDSARMIQFYDGNEFTSILFVPKDDFKVTLHTTFFDESIRFSGKGASVNNAINTCYLADEMNTFRLNETLNYFKDMDEPDTVEYFNYVDSLYGQLTSLLTDFEKEHKHFHIFSKNERKKYEWFQGRKKSSLTQHIKFNEMIENTFDTKFINMKGVNAKGDSVSIQDFTGKPILIDFWATWCGPCKMEIPFLEAIEKEYGDRVNIVSTAVWCKEDAWKEFLPKFDVKNHIYIPRGNEKATADAYMIYGIPRYVLLDRYMNIVDINAERPSSGRLQAQLEEILEW